MTCIEDTRCTQVNLHRARAAAANISHYITRNGIDIALIQEPWAPKEQVLGINLKGHKVIWCKNDGRPRTAIIIGKNIKHVCLSEFLTRNLVPIEANVLIGGASRKVVLASAYFAGDREAPPGEVLRLATYCKNHNIPLLIGSDANAHSESWGSTDTNTRGELILEFLSQADLTTYNIGNRPTFETKVRQEVLDITIGSYFWCGLISKWRVSPEPSLSDHKIILFNLKATTLQQAARRNPRKTHWETFDTKLSENLSNISRQGRMQSSEQLDYHVTNINEGIISAFHDSCKLISNKAPRTTSWWNDKLEDLKRKTRRAANARKKRGGSEEYSKLLTMYSNEIRKAKRASYRKFCEEIAETPVAARLHKALGRDRGSTISTIRKPDGTYTENEEERAELLLRTHFPGSVTLREMNWPPHRANTPNKDWVLAKQVITYHKVRWAVQGFQAFKSPGPDGIFPCFLQRALDRIIGHLIDVFQTSLATGWIPEAWKAARVVFIPKPGKKDTTHPKSFRPISLTSFTLKTMEKIVDNHIRTNILNNYPLHCTQHAYLEGRSTETALYQCDSEINSTLASQEACITLFLDMEGAFDNTSHAAIEDALRRRGVEIPIVGWIMALLKSRLVEIEVGDKLIGAQTTRGCPQGGVLSPLLWSLVIDDLLQELTANKIDCQGYADDVKISVRGKISIDSMCERVQLGLNICDRWCKKVGLRLNPEKTGIVVFTNKKKLPGWKPIKLGDTEIKVHNQFKYLGIILDSKLTWNPQIKEACAKAIKAQMVCNRLAGKNWGCSPKMVHWMYTAIVRPRLTYGAVAWADKLEEGKARSEVDKVQRLACLTITGAMRSSPTRALEVALGLPPLHLHVKELALKSLVRFSREGFGPQSIIKSKDKEETLNKLPILQYPTDIMRRKLIFGRNFKVELSNKCNWKGISSTYAIDRGTLIWFTDGSKTKEGTGAGVFGPRSRYSEAMGQHPNICQAEIHAIERCAAINIQRGYVGMKIAILSDSQAAIKALDSYTVTSKMVWDCITRLNELGQNNSLTIYWVPGHCGIRGNEEADELARMGSSTPMTGPEPFCGVNAKLAEGILRINSRLAWDNQWMGTQGCRQAKRLLGYSDTKKAKTLLGLTRDKLRKILAILTGHGKFKKHLTVMGLQGDKVCKFCKAEDETAEHIVLDCMALVQHRQSALGHRTLDTRRARLLKPAEILVFLEKTGLLQTL